MGWLIGDLISRGMTSYEESDFLKFQTLPLKDNKMLQRLRLEAREEAYLWIVYKANIPTAGLLLPEPGNAHHFPRLYLTNLELSLLEG